MTIERDYSDKDLRAALGSSPPLEKMKMDKNSIIRKFIDALEPVDNFIMEHWQYILSGDAKKSLQLSLTVGELRAIRAILSETKDVAEIHAGIERQHWLDAIGKPLKLEPAGFEWLARFDGEQHGFIGIGRTKNEAIDALIAEEIELVQP